MIIWGYAFGIPWMPQACLRQATCSLMLQACMPSVITYGDCNTIGIPYTIGMPYSYSVIVTDSNEALSFTNMQSFFFFVPENSSEETRCICPIRSVQPEYQDRNCYAYHRHHHLNDDADSHEFSSLLQPEYFQSLWVMTQMRWPIVWYLAMKNSHIWHFLSLE